MDLIIVGGGVSGLTTAHTLLARGHRVRVIAAEWHPDIVSSVAAAVWYPYKVDHPQVSAWGQTSFERFRALAAAGHTGVKMVQGIEYRFDAATEVPAWAGAVEAFESVDEVDVPAPFRSALRFRVPIIETPRYLAWLRAEVATRATLSTRRVETLHDLAGQADAIINCAGLAARELVGDELIYPIRGQIVKLPPGGMEEFVLVQETDDHPEPSYIIPRADGIVCGGTAQPYQWDTTPDAATTKAILRRVATLRPDLAARPPLETRVGLRPARPTIRLEAEHRGGMLVIHNYGHGGAGFTLSWGCAAAVANLLDQTTP